MMEDDNIEKLFGDVFEDFEVTPPASVKSGIDKVVAAKSRGPIIWVFAGILLLTSSILAVYLSPGTKNTGQSHFASAKSVSTEQAESTHSIQHSENAGKTSSNNHNEPGTKETGNTLPGTDSREEKLDNKRGITTASNLTDKSQQPASSGKTVAIQQEKKTGAKQVKSSSDQTNRRKNTKQGKTRIQNSDKLSSPSSSTTKISNPNSNDPTKTASTDDKKTADSLLTAKSTNSNASASSVKENLPKENTVAQLPAANNSSDSLKNGEKDQAGQGKSEEKNSKNDSKHWYAAVYPGIGFSKMVKPVQTVSGQPGFGIQGGIYRNFGTNGTFKSGIDFGYQTGNYQWDQWQTTTNQTTMDSLVSVYNPLDSTWYTDTVFYTVTSTDSLKTTDKASYTQFSIGLSAQLDLPLSDQFGFVATPGFRYATSKFQRNSDGTTFSGKNFQLGLGIDCYYDWKYWRFMIGVSYSQTWMKNSQNPFDAKGVSQWTPRIGIGIRF